MFLHVQSLAALPQLPAVLQIMHRTHLQHQRAVVLDAAAEPDSKLMTPERAGGRHRSPHGGDGNIDPFMTEDPWKSSSLQLSPAIIEAKRRVQMMRDTFVQAPPFPSETNNVQPSNADLMAKLDRMMGAMALKEDVHVAQLEVVTQMRYELAAHIEPLRSKLKMQRRPEVVE